MCAVEKCHSLVNRFKPFNPFGSNNMNRFIGSSLALLSFLISNASQASTLDDIKNQLQSEPYMAQKPAGNDAIFAKYCIGNPNSSEIPFPNYKNSLVIAAAQKLTESKTAANARLTQVAQEQFLSSISTVQEYLNNIISSSSDKEMVKNAKALLAEISKPNIKSISPAASASYKAMTAIVLEQLKKEVSALTPKLQAELKGIDVAVFTKLAAELEKYAVAEIKGMDIKKFETAFAKVYPIIKANIKTVDYAKAAQLAQQVLGLEVTADDAGEYITNAQEMAQSLAKALANGAPTANDKIDTANYYLSDMYYYLTEAKDLKYTGAGFDEVFTEVGVENSKISLKYVAQLNESLNELMKDVQNNMSDITYSAQDLSYSIESNIEGGAIKLFDASNEKYAIEFINQVKTFQSENILENVKSIGTNLKLKTEQGNQTAFNIADSAMYSLEQLTVSADFKAVITAMKAELTKQQTQHIISTITTANTELQKATEFNQETYYKLSDLKYYLGQGVSVTPATQKNVDSFVKVLDNSENVSNISSYMSAVVEESKEAEHFYFYGGVRRLYKLGNNVPAAAAKAGANKEAHWFITQLCGEFRDRATMIEAKLKWVQNMNILPKSSETVVQPETLAQAKNVWMRITAKAYYPYINVAARVWEERRAAQERYITIGEINDIDNPVVGLTVCETKYVFAKYVATGEEFQDLATYDAGYEEYKKDCPKADISDYYDFRGDSNFKHYSPESNGMIWAATSLAKGCSAVDKANNGIYTDADCENYFKAPFAARYNAARAGLAAWLFRDDKHSDVFSSQGQMVAIYPHKEAALAPFAFGFTETSTDGALFDYNPKWLGVPMAWNSSDIGFNGFTGLGTADANQEQAYVLIRDAVDRHTDWYSSGYNDSNGTSKNQAYSPFVASSYVMQSSDGFTQCGTTVQCPDDGLKRWMFVFRIKAANWYTPARIQNNEPIDFDKMWFDETSFGVSGLADGEHAWDRLGTAQEEEFDSILYLINVSYDDSFGGEFEGEFDGEEGD